MTQAISDRQEFRSPPRLVRLRDAADERGDAERLCVRGEVGGHERPFVGQEAAPGREMGQVRTIGPARVVGDACLDQSGDLIENGVGHFRAANITRPSAERGDRSATGTAPPSFDPFAASED